MIVCFLTNPHLVASSTTGRSEGILPWELVMVFLPFLETMPMQAMTGMLCEQYLSGRVKDAFNVH
jgi:hypothetical protein